MVLKTVDRRAEGYKKTLTKSNVQERFEYLRTLMDNPEAFREAIHNDWIFHRSVEIWCNDDEEMRATTDRRRKHGQKRKTSKLPQKP